MKLAQNAILLSRLIQENASLVKISSVRTFFLNSKHRTNLGFWVLSQISINITNNCFRNLTFLA